MAEPEQFVFLDDEASSFVGSLTDRIEEIARDARQGTPIVRENPPIQRGGANAKPFFYRRCEHCEHHRASVSFPDLAAGDSHYCPRDGDLALVCWDEQ